MIALNRCPPGWVQRSSCQRHSPRSAGTCLPFSSQAQLPDRWIPANRSNHAPQAAPLELQVLVGEPLFAHVLVVLAAVYALVHPAERRPEPIVSCLISRTHVL